MSISEADRHRLYEHLREVLDDHDADTLMAHLPSGGAADTVSSSDLKAELADLRSELYRVTSEQTRTVVLAILASNATLTALVFGAARLA